MSLLPPVAGHGGLWQPTPVGVVVCSSSGLLAVAAGSLVCVFNVNGVPLAAVDLTAAPEPRQATGEGGSTQEPFPTAFDLDTMRITCLCIGTWPDWRRGFPRLLATGHPGGVVRVWQLGFDGGRAEGGCGSLGKLCHTLFLRDTLVNSAAPAPVTVLHMSSPALIHVGNETGDVFSWAVPTPLY
jgi:hypothetical protein